MLIEEFDQALKDARPPSKPAPEMLYHYTTAGGFEGIVKSRAFRATLRPHPHFVKFSRVLYDREEQEEKIDLVLDAAADSLREHDAGDDLLALAAPLLSRLLRTEWRVVIRIRPGVPVKIDFDTTRGVIRRYLMFALEERTGVPMPLESLHVLPPARLDAAGVERVVPIRSGIPFAD